MIEKNIEKNEPNPSVDFETAISHTGFGWYNRKMLIYFMPIALTTIMCTASPSFIVPVTRCYFELTPLKEGMMFGAFYLGMLLSSFLWGFLIDTMGRQKLLFYGLLFTAIFELLSGLAQQFWTFIILKIVCGFISCCPNSLVFTFLSEFYDKQHRDTVVLCAGGFVAVSFLVQPILAYVFIPLDIDFELFYGIIAINNWRLFVIAGSSIMFLSAYLTYFMDESPKFLMAVGRHKEALDVFRKIYSQNTGNPPESYPIKSLVSQDKCIKSVPSELNNLDQVKEGWSQIKLLFGEPYLYVIVLSSVLQFMTLLLFTTFRFKLPKMYATILAAEGLLDSNTETIVTPPDCLENISVLVDPNVYVKNMYIGAGSLTVFWIAVYGSQYLDKHYVFLMFNTLCGICIGIFPWTDGIVTLILATIYVGITFINVSLVISMSISVVPTTLRNVAFSVCMTFGIIGTILGNLVLPTLAEVNNELSFMVHVLLHSACLIVAVILMKIKKKIPDSQPY